MQLLASGGEFSILMGQVLVVAHSLYVLKLGLQTRLLLLLRKGKELCFAEVDVATDVVTEVEYDDNWNQALTRYPSAVDGSQPDNVLSSIYDERDLVFQVTRGEGGPDAATDQVDYDGNRNVVRFHEGVPAAPRVTETTYDWFDRIIRLFDPMGNDTTFGYDPNNNVTGLRSDGELVDRLQKNSDGKFS